MTEGESRSVALGADPLPTFRATTPEETLAKVAPWLASAGITRVANVTGLDAVGIPVFVATRPNSRSLSVTQGKGPTPSAARISAIMEAMEHFHAETATLPLRLCRVNEVEEFGLVCNLSRLPGSGWNGAHVRASTRLLWTSAREFWSGTERWVPYELVHLDMTLPLPESSGHFPLSSNGLASGNTFEEACLHGLLEVVERDARTLFFLKGGFDRDDLKVPSSSISNAACLDLLDKLSRAKLAVSIWNVTSDTRLPTFVVGIMELLDNPFRRVPVAYGCGCHLNRSVALVRAITEAAQTRLTNITGSRDDTLPAALEFTTQPSRQQEQRTELIRGTGTQSFEELPSYDVATASQGLELVADRLKVCGIDEILTVDLSKQGWPICVARVIVPGMEPLYELDGFTPGTRGIEQLREHQ